MEIRLNCRSRKGLTPDLNPGCLVSATNSLWIKSRVNPIHTSVVSGAFNLELIKVINEGS